MNQKLRNSNKNAGIGLTSSLIVLMGALASQAVYAQEEEPKAEQDAGSLVEEVIVQGTRANLQNAQDIKRDSDTFVDAISAEDIGSLPDRSVLEAIQRMPGVSVERFAGPDDPDHFSVEGSGAIIRGMTQTRSEFNGRDSFTASSGRGLNFQDVPPELMGGVNVYKNQTADMIEGGIGGTISLRTRKPFDQDGRQLAFTADYSWGDIARKGSPSLSGLWSDRWDTDMGEFGVLVSAAGSQLYGESHGIQSDAYSQYYADMITGAEPFAEAAESPDDRPTVWMPNSANMTMKEDDRNRKGASVVVQWKNPEDTIQVTGEYIRSDSTLDWNENSAKYQGGYPDGPDDILSNAVPGTKIEFNKNGMFQSGTLNALTSRPDGDNAPWAAPSTLPFGPKGQTDVRVHESNSLVEDFSLNIEWQPMDNLDLSADYQYIQAESVADDVQVMFGLFSGQTYDISGDTPTLHFQDPWYGERDSARAEGSTEYESGYPGFSGDPDGDSNYFQDPNNYWWRSAMDHYERSKGESSAIRIDGTYYFEDLPFLKSIKAGIRFADREQLVRRTSYNWKSLAPEWNGGVLAGWLTSAETAEQADDYERIDWSDFHRGGIFDVDGDYLLHPTAEFAKAISGRIEDRTREPYVSEAGDWDTLGTANQPNVEDEYGLFTPGDINYTREKNKAVYVRLDFEGDSEIRYSGNIGIRYAKLERQSDGAIVFNNLTPENAPPVSAGDRPLTSDGVREYLQGLVDSGLRENFDDARSTEALWIGEDKNYLDPNDVDFANNQELPATAKTDTSLFLPSFNLKVELTSDLITRFAFAKAAAYPDISDVRNRLEVGILNYVPAVRRFDYPEESDPNHSYNGMISRAYIPGWTGSGGNPYLEPMLSTQYDVSLEWYFSDVGQLTGTIFHKNLNNYFIKGANYQYITNPTSNQSRWVDVDSTINGGKAKMDGFELSYQQFFEGKFEGFGAQATYTLIDASGVPNNNTDYEEEVAELEAQGEEVFTDTGIRVSLDNVPLQGQSEHTVNLIGMYENDLFEARLAYNWRSKYLLTTRDVISKAPLWFDDRGQLDGSVFFNATDTLKVGLQATNLLDTQSETLMMLNDDGLTAGRSWFLQDRRIALVIKGNF